jgi:hypothetical protein
LVVAVQRLNDVPALNTQTSKRAFNHGHFHSSGRTTSSGSLSIR